MTFDFDRVVDRRASDSYKWLRFGDASVLPMPVADMDFPSPPPVIEALQARAGHGIFGYGTVTPDLADAVVAMHRDRQGWTIRPEWLVWLPGLEVGLNLVCRLTDSPHEAVATVTPIYPPFLSAPVNMNRRRITIPLAEDPTRGYIHDTAAIDAALSDPAARIFLLCSPHNPTGRVWTRQELERVAEICLRRNVIICADEIHSGLILDADKPHIPFATLAPEVQERTITLMSPSKTFNLAGLCCAYAIIPDEQLRARFRRAARGLATELNVFGYAACAAAYRHGWPWRDALLEYLRDNRDRVEHTIRGAGGLRMHHVQATYLAWIDCRTAEMDAPARHFRRAGLALSDGEAFGAPGFVRLNFGCPRSVLEDGLRRLARALDTR